MRRFPPFQAAGRRRLTPALLLSMALLPPPAAPGGPPVETGTVFRAADLLPADLLSGPRHRVDAEVRNDGYMNHYTLRTEQGDLPADGDLAVATVVRELNALVELREVSRTEAFLQAMGKAAASPLAAAYSVITQPVETLKGIPGGVVRLFRRTSRQLKEGYETVQETREKIEQRQAEKEARRAAGEPEPELSEEERKARARQALEKGKDFAVEKLGFQRARRQWARELGVDPYTANPRLQEELDRVAWATTAGGLVVRQVDLPSVEVVGRLGDVRKLVWDLDPLDLRLRDEKTLRSLGATDEAIEAFYAAGALSTSGRAYFVSALGRLSGVEGRPLALAAVTAAESREEADFLLRSYELLALVHEKRTPLARLLPSNSLPLAVTVSGRGVAALAVDHLLWTREMSEADGLAANELKRAAPEGLDLWLGGTCSANARQGLEGRGWRVEEKGFVKLAGGT